MMLQIQQTNMTFLNRLPSIENSVSCPVMYDIIGIQETKMEGLTGISLPDYAFRLKHRKSVSNTVKLVVSVPLTDINMNNTFTFKLLSQTRNLYNGLLYQRLSKQNDLLCGVIYISPEISSL